ncbi:MAG: hypothetical protein QXF42_00085 [Sulfolobales archaeon]
MVNAWAGVYNPRCRRFNRDVLANVICTPGEYEVIVNDVLAEELGIEIVVPRRGLWRIKGEGGVRESVEPMFWLE